MLLPGVASDDELAERAERLRLAVNETPIVHGDVRVELTISVGCALAADGSQTLDALLDTADSCLYAAKHEGRDRVSLLPEQQGRRRIDRGARGRRPGSRPGVREQPPGGHPGGARRAGRARWPF